MGVDALEDDMRSKEVARRVREDQYQLVARSALRAVPLNIVNAILLAFLIHNYTGTVELSLWLGTLIVLPCIRLAIMWGPRRDSRTPSRNEMLAYVLASGVVGAAWGMTPFMVSNSAPGMVDQVISLVLAGMAAGGVLTSAGERRVIWAYTGPALGLWALSLMMQDSHGGIVSALMLCVFFFGISTLAKTYTQTLIEAVTANLALEEQREKTQEQAAAMARLAEHNDQAARRAEEAARSSARMLTNMSHELRSPLNGVLGMSQLLAETRLSDDQARMNDRVRDSGETLDGLINTVLEVSRIDAGQLELVVEDVTARELGDRIRREAKSAADAKGLGLTMKLEGDVNRALRADGERLMHMSRVLVNNAIRFTEEGGVTVRLNSTLKPNGMALMRVEIHDTGIGVPLGARDELFTAMAAEDMNPSIKEAGTSLGLFLVRKLSEMMNGKAGYHPAPNEEGSIFWFEVSLRPSIKVDRYADGEQMSLSTRRLRILVGESDAARRSVLLGYLKSFNCVVTCASSGFELLDALGASAYDAVVLGQSLKETSPEDASADIRALPTTASMTPVLRLSTAIDDFLQVNAVETLVRSPVSADSLLSGLRQTLAHDPNADAQLTRIA